MAYQLFHLPKSTNIGADTFRLESGAKAYFFETGTTTPQDTYQDEELQTPHAHPVEADASGVLPPIYLDPSLQYKLTLTKSDESLIYTVDPVNDSILSQSIIGQLLNPIEVGETGVVNTLHPRGHVYRYGTNATPGTTDMTTAFQNAALSSLTPYAPSDAMLVTASITLRDNQHWTLDGTRISFTGDTLEVFTATAVNDWSMRGRYEVVGDNGDAGATSGSASAIRITDCMRFHVDAPVAKNIRGWGIRVRPGSSTAERGEKGVIVAPQLYACYRGIECEAGEGAEYINVVSPIISRCNIGARVAAGNLNVTGGSIVDNTTGVYLVNGTNHGHGIFSGVQINHNTTQVYADTVTNGQTFTGCHVYQGIIHFQNSTGVVFKSGIVDVDEYRFEESDGCGFVDNTMPNDYTNTISNNYDTTNSYTVWEGNKTKAGGPWNGALGNIKGVRVTASQASDQVISAANVNATATIILDTKATASANQSTQSVAAYLLSYDTTTGIYTCVKGGNGKVRIAAQLVITVNAADADNFQVFLTHSVLGDYYFSMTPLGSHASATSWVATLNVELPIDLTNTLRFRIAGSGVANNVTIENSGGTKASVEGL